VDAGRTLLRADPVDLGDLARAAIERLEPYAREQAVTLEAEGLEPVTVAGDPLWLNQVLTNLITNGLKYTPAGGAVTVRVREVTGADGVPEAEIAVADTGIGISGEDLPHIFDRFYRVEAGRARAAMPGGKQPGGTGLGLSITRWAVEQHGGTVTVTSEPGRGSEFRVRLPVAGAGEPNPTA
jgi:signal transduction histidine kinase